MISTYRFKDRGPTSSHEYNERTRETSETFLDLLGRVLSAEAEVSALSTLTAVEHSVTTNMFESLSAQLEEYQQKAQDATQNTKYCTVFDQTAIVRADIDGKPISDQLGWEGDVGIAVLPYTSRVSKLGFADANGNWVIDPAVKYAFRCTYLDGQNTVDATYEANEFARAIDHNAATAFLVRSAAGAGTSRVLTAYITVPSGIASGALVNYIELEPAPRSGLTLKRLCISTKPGAALDDETDATQWEDLWIPSTIEQAESLLNKRYRPPQENPVLVQTSCGPRRYYFGERRVTAIKVVLEATSTMTIAEGPEYFMGLRHIDVGHVTFGQSGRLVFEYQMPTGVTSVTEVTARLANPGTSQDGLDGVGVQTPTLSLYYKSNGVWAEYVAGTVVASIDSLRIEATLGIASNGCTPVLIGFDVRYAR